MVGGVTLLSFLLHYRLFVDDVGEIIHKLEGGIRFG
jgi:hypothetical protein